MDEICVFVVDDDENSLLIISEMLYSLNIACVAIQDSTQVEEALRTMNVPRAIFLDLEMPKINGYEILDTLRAYTGPDVPIIACTVHTNEINTARKLGFNGFIAKPLSSDRFPDQLDRVLNGIGVWEAY
ncbi:MAG TPA: response regulator [Phototrophicaceae bacterium]|nr:response regulator [Phototrophicaceae bacterium]